MKCPTAEGFLTEDEGAFYLGETEVGDPSLAPLQGPEHGSIGLGATMSSVVSRRMLIDMAWASSRLKGNTYPLLDTSNSIDSAAELANAEGRPSSS